VFALGTSKPSNELLSETIPETSTGARLTPARDARPERATGIGMRASPNARYDCASLTIRPVMPSSGCVRQSSCTIATARCRSAAFAFAKTEDP
jgi:hypothetical protein